MSHIGEIVLRGNIFGSESGACELAERGLDVW